MIVFIDTGVLGAISSPDKTGYVNECQEWFYGLFARGVFLISSDLCDYEVRRGLILDQMRTSKGEGLANLDEVKNLIYFLSMTKLVMFRASQLWAISRRQGMPTADEKNIDADVIISAQCQLFQEENLGQNLVVATTNVKHLSRFISAQEWHNIK